MFHLGTVFSSNRSNTNQPGGGCEFSKILLSVRYLLLLLTWPLFPPTTWALSLFTPEPVLKRRRIFTQRYFSTASSWSCFGDRSTNQPHLARFLCPCVDRGLADSWPLSKSNNQPRGVTRPFPDTFPTALCTLTFLRQFFVNPLFPQRRFFLLFSRAFGEKLFNFQTHTF